MPEQSIFRVQKDKNNPYVMLNKKLLNDTELSWKAKGVLAYLLSLPDDWKIYEEEIAKHSKDSRDSLRTAIKELIKRGYIARERNRNEKGQLQGSTYCVYEVSTYDGISNIGESNIGKTNIGNPTLLNNDITNNDDRKYTDKQLTAAAELVAATRKAEPEKKQLTDKQIEKLSSANIQADYKEQLDKFIKHGIILDSAQQKILQDMIVKHDKETISKHIIDAELRAMNSGDLTKTFDFFAEGF